MPSNRGQYTRKGQGPPRKKRQRTTTTTQQIVANDSNDTSSTSGNDESVGNVNGTGVPPEQVTTAERQDFGSGLAFDPSNSEYNATRPSITQETNLDLVNATTSPDYHSIALFQPSTALTQAALTKDNELSWSNMFESFLESRGRESAVDKAAITYLGESFPLATVLEDLRKEGRFRLHHPGQTRNIQATPSSISAANAHPPHICEADLTFLQSKGVFTPPPQATANNLVKAFIDKVYPFYPMVILQDFLRQYEDNTLPWILYHSVCFAGATFCPLATLQLAGYPSRKAALEKYYDKAKALFDFDYEKDKVVLLQSITLLTFWPSGPNDVWTFYHWLGFGATLAESLGLHRSMNNIVMNQRDRSLLKRIWWILVVRDAFGAVLYGRPVRINGIHCDVEFTTADDFIHDYHPDVLPVSDHRIRADYFAQVSKLAVNLANITTNRFIPGHQSTEQDTARAINEQALQEWRNELPTTLDWELVPASSNNFVATLCILYHSNIIFMNIQRPRPTSNDAVTQVGMQFSSPATLAASLSAGSYEAGERILGVATQLATNESLTSMPHEMFTGLFVAEVVLYTKSCSDDSAVAKLAHTQVKCCQLLFHEVRNFWDPATWVMQLFNGLLGKEQSGTTQRFGNEINLADVSNFDILHDWETFLGEI